MHFQTKNIMKQKIYFGVLVGGGYSLEKEGGRYYAGGGGQRLRCGKIKKGQTVVAKAN